MKRYPYWLLPCIFLFLLTACGNEHSDPAPDDNTAGSSIEALERSDTDLSSDAEETASAEAQPAFSAELIGKSFVSGDYEYTIQEDGTAFISGYIGNDSEITIPLQLDGYEITGVADSAFPVNTSITSLVIPGQIREIGSKAFSGCKALSRVVIEDGVESIGYRAFQNGDNNSCSVSELIISDCLLKMGDHPFGLSNQVSHTANGLCYIGNFVVDFADDFDGQIVFADGTRGIADEALDRTWGSNKNKISDETIVFPDSLVYIGENAFVNQSDIKYFKIPASVEKIGAHAMQFEFVNNSYSLFHSNETRKIYGQAASAAEQYTAENGLNFVIIH